MICIKCSNDTRVANSRPHKKTPSVWRRRQCKTCGVTFTTTEVIADDAFSFVITTPSDTNAASAFSLPRLMLSIVKSMGHRPEPASADEAYWLAQTVAQAIQATATDSLDSSALATITHETLTNFDPTAGQAYGIRHGIITPLSQRPVRGRPRTHRRAIT